MGREQAAQPTAVRRVTNLKVGGESHRDAQTQLQGLVRKRGQDPSPRPSTCSETSSLLPRACRSRLFQDSNFVIKALPECPVYRAFQA